jgi:hypothetical protein
VSGFKIIRQLNHTDLQNSLSFDLLVLQLFKDAACQNHSTVIAELKTKASKPMIV